MEIWAIERSLLKIRIRNLKREPLSNRTMPDINSEIIVYLEYAIKINKEKKAQVRVGCF